MRLAKMRIKRYRAILDSEMVFEPLTVLIGRNGAGKSCFLQALRLFMDPNLSPSTEDFFNRDASSPIEIEAEYVELTPEELNEFASSIEAGRLIVKRKFPDGSYYAKAFGCKELEPLRKNLKANELAIELDKFVKSGKFPGLKAVKRNIGEELDRWEKENVDRCEGYFRAGLFQGPPNIAGGKLRGRTHFVYIPPVREAEVEASSGRNSALSTLVAPLVKAITDRNSEVAKHKNTVTESYAEYRKSIEAAPEKETLESDLTAMLRRYDPKSSAKIRLSLDETLALPPPQPKVWLTEDGFEGEVSRKGHGLQRLFIFSILELYERLRIGTDTPSEGTILLAVEEPELYQHPIRARALADTLRELCYPGDKKPFQFQIVYTTHSPWFVDVEKFACVRRIEKVQCEDNGPMKTKVHHTTLAEVQNDALSLLGKDIKSTEDSSWPRIRAILNTRLSEGFFADSVVLIEGQEDEGILSGLAEMHEKTFDRLGIALLPVEGKTKLVPLSILFRRLGIRTFVLFDADTDGLDQNDAYNKALLSIIASPGTKIKTQICPFGAVWATTFVDEVKKEFGETIWQAEFEKACQEYSMSADQGKKKFAVMKRTVQLLSAQGKKSNLLETLWTAILKRCGDQISLAPVELKS